MQFHQFEQAKRSNILTLNLKIIADDLGLAKSVNDGIIFLLKEGRIDGASLMANGEAFDDAVEKLKEINDPHVGAHLVLVEEQSLSGIKLPADHRHFFIKYILGLIKLSDIEKELRAQLDKIAGSGVKLAFLNSHQHLHLLPEVADIVIKLAIEYQIPYIRVVNEPTNLLNGKLFRKLQSLFLNFLSKSAAEKVKRAGLECNDFFVGFVNAGNLTNSDMELAKSLAEKYPDKIVELGSHPGYENEELKQKYKHWGNYNWERELNLLK